MRSTKRFFSQNFRANIRELCVCQLSRVQSCAEAPLPSPPLQPQVKQFEQHVCPLKCHQSDCPRHLCASYCIGCSAAGVVRQQVTVQISFQDLQYLEYPSVERGPGNRAGCSQQQKRHLHQLLSRSFTGLMMDLCRTVTRFCRTIALNCSTIHVAV